VLRQVSITGLAAVGMTLVILIAGIDLSVGSVMALGSVVTGLLLTHAGWTSVTGVVIAVSAIGFGIGALNGALIVWGRLQPFIATLAMMVTILGVARLTAGQDSAVLPVYPGSNATSSFDALRAMIWGIVPAPSLFFLASVVIFGAVLRFTTFGRYVYAVGGNEAATRLSGIAVDRVKVVCYACAGMLACLAGVLYVAQYRQGKPDAGTGLELDAIAAVVIGGTSLMGGRGGIAGTLVGVLIFGFMSNLLQLYNVNSNLQLVFKGAIIVATVLLQERNLSTFFERWGRRETS